MDGSGADDTLNADAVLAGGLESSSKDDLGDTGEVLGSRVENDKGVLASQLKNNWGETLGSTGSDMMSHRLRSDKGNMANPRVRGQMVGGLRPARDSLDQLRIMAVCDESSPGDAGEPLARPRSLLRDLDDDAVAGKERADDGAQHVVEGVVPADEGGDDAEGLVVDRVALVHHEEVGWAAFGAESLFAMGKRPLDLLDRDKNLAELRINHRLATVQPGNLANLLGIVQHILHQTPQHGPPLLKGRLAPLLLGVPRARDGAVNGRGRRRVHEAEELARRRGVALDGGAAGELDAGLVDGRVGLRELGRGHGVAAGWDWGGQAGDADQDEGEEDGESGCDEGDDGFTGRVFISLVVSSSIGRSSNSREVKLLGSIRIEAPPKQHHHARLVRSHSCLFFSLDSLNKESIRTRRSKGPLKQIHSPRRKRSCRASSA